MAIGQFLDDNDNPIYYDEDEAPWIPPDASFDPNNPSGVINTQNPSANPSQPFVNAGETGGYLEGTGVTVGAGSSITPAQAAAYRASALAAGIPEAWINDYLARNPNDYSRMEAAYHSGQTGSGPDAQGGTTTPATTATGGTQGNQGALAPPPNAIGWMPTLDLPTWTPPAPFSYHDYVPGTFTAPTIEEARNEPGFKFALDEGRRQMEAAAAFKGIGRTGGTVKRLIGYGQDMADTNYNNVFNRSKLTFDTNEGNRADAFTTNYGVARDTYDYGYTASQDKHTADTAEVTGEYTPKKEEAVLTHSQAFAEWLAKLGLSTHIFDEGSD